MLKEKLEAMRQIAKALNEKVDKTIATALDVKLKDDKKEADKPKENPTKLAEDGADAAPSENEIAEVVEFVNTLAKRIEALEEKIGAASTSETELKKEIVELKKEVEAFGKKPASETTKLRNVINTNDVDALVNVNKNFLELAKIRASAAANKK